MILIFGGTSEGRAAAGVLDEAGKEFFYSTRGSEQQLDLHHGIRLTGAMDASETAYFCKSHSVKLIVDAAHPFAARLHEQVAEVSRKTGIPVVRYERIYPSEDATGDVEWCAGMQEAVEHILKSDCRCVLALTGVQTIAPLRPMWQAVSTYFRILNRDSSRVVAEKSGFPSSRLLYYAQDADIAEMIKKCGADVVLTKESGISGGFMEKLEGVRNAGARLVAIRRPAISEDFIMVEGPDGLRRQVEKLMPGFFALRSGLTTGTCATAAAKAATMLLLGEEAGHTVKIRLPRGERIDVETDAVWMKDNGCAVARVVKDAGDDPDVTDGCSVVAEAEFTSGKGVEIEGGEGIGRVTLPGLGIPIGEAAINATPREMIKREIASLTDRGIRITLSVPEGKRLALSTFNPRIGIEGGISIIGTSGIVRPFSNEAFLGAIEREVDVALASGDHKIVLNSGAKSELYVKGMFPDIQQAAFIHYGNAVGDAVDICRRRGAKEAVVALMLGKAAKLAEGHLDTHSHKVTLNRSFIASLAVEARCSEETIDSIHEITLARNLPDVVRKDEAGAFFEIMARRCHTALKSMADPMTVEVILLDDKGTVLARV